MVQKALHAAALWHLALGKALKTYEEKGTTRHTTGMTGRPGARTGATAVRAPARAQPQPHGRPKQRHDNPCPCGLIKGSTST